MKLKKKREVWVVRFANGVYHIKDAQSNKTLCVTDGAGEYRWGDDAMSAWYTRESAEAFANEMGWKVV